MNEYTISRRVFLRRAAAGLGALSVGPLFSACAVQGTQAASRAKQAPQTVEASEPPATDVPLVASAQKTRSRLVRARHVQVWQGDALSEEALKQMLDSAITALTGLEDAGKAWSSLFKAGERVAIKVNAIISGATNTALVLAVAGRLQDLGIAAEDILVYDRSDDELKNAGFALNQTGKGLRVRGNNDVFGEQSWKVLDSDVHLSRALDDCDALINMPVLKGLTIGGISFAMKNHYGTVDNPSRFHYDRFAGGVTGLNALDPIRQKTRLIIGDVLAKETHADWTDYAVVGGESAILVSRDPLTVDLLGLLMCYEALGKKGISTAAIKAQAPAWLKAGAALGLGAEDITQMDLKEIEL